MCASDSYRSQYHTRVPNASVSQRASDALPELLASTLPEITCKHCPRLLASTRKRTLEYLQSYSRALAMELMHEYSRALSNGASTAIIRVGSKFCGCKCEMAIRGKLVPGDALS